VTKYKSGTFIKALVRGLMGVALALSGVVVSGLGATAPALAQSGDRTLYLHYTHTGETTRITFRRNGRYDQSGLRQLNRFLRDWRTGKSIEMDPALFDLVWTVYQEVDATQPIHVVSSYRAPESNKLLRSRSSGVAKNSQHTKGTAMDFFIPGVPISELREVAMRHQVGGVGYYPTSGSPFVHLDTGNVRAWPRMTRAQLKNLFPDGRTLHLPAEGNTPLSREGRQYAMAEWKKCQSVPCVQGVANTQVTGGGNGRNLFDMIFGGDRDEVDTVQVASNEPQQRSVTSVSVPQVTPVPAPRADILAYRTPGPAPVPAAMPQTVMVAMRGDGAIATEPPTPATAAPAADAGRMTVASDGEITEKDPAPASELIDQGQFAVAALAGNDRPTPRELMSRDEKDLPIVSAYAPARSPEPDAQRALQRLIERRSTADTATTDDGPTDNNGLRGSLRTASLGSAPQISLDDAASLFASTWSAVDAAKKPGLRTDTETLTGSIGPTYSPIDVEARPVTLTAPDLEHVANTMVAPVVATDVHFGVMFQPDRGDFAPATELGAHSPRMTFTRGPDGTPPAHAFAVQKPVFLASL